MQKWIYLSWINVFLHHELRTTNLTLTRRMTIDNAVRNVGWNSMERKYLFSISILFFSCHLCWNSVDAIAIVNMFVSESGTIARAHDKIQFTSVQFHEYCSENSMDNLPDSLWHFFFFKLKSTKWKINERFNRFYQRLAPQTKWITKCKNQFYPHKHLRQSTIDLIQTQWEQFDMAESQYSLYGGGEGIHTRYVNDNFSVWGISHYYNIYRKLKCFPINLCCFSVLR